MESSCLFIFDANAKAKIAFFLKFYFDLERVVDKHRNCPLIFSKMHVNRLNACNSGRIG